MSAVAYFSAQPHNLGTYDEAVILYEAKRILHGEVLYRDIFDIYAPATYFWMAFLYWIFGVSMATAKVSMAVLHGSTAAMLFLTGRALRISTGLALVVPAAYIALCQPVWPFATPHWFSTFVSVVLLFTLLCAPWPHRTAWALLPGLITGILITFQQSRGCVTAGGVGALFVLLHLLDRHYGAARSWRALAAQLACFGAGILLVAVPVFFAIIAVAGFGPVFRCLVVFPLVNYRTAVSTEWGSLLPFWSALAAYTSPSLLRYAPPFIILILLARGTWDLVRRANVDELRSVTILLVFNLLSIGSILNYPDIIHIAFIAPIFFVTIVETVSRGLDRLADRGRSAQVGRALLTVLLLSLMALQAYRNLQRRKSEYPLAHETAFGLVHFQTQREIDVIEDIRRALPKESPAEVFIYPPYPALYLTVGIQNPTPFQMLVPQQIIPGYSPDEHSRRVIGILEMQKDAYVVIPLALPNDALVEYLLLHYEPVAPNRFGVDRTRPFSLLKRRHSSQPAAPARDQGSPGPEGGPGAPFKINGP